MTRPRHYPRFDTSICPDPEQCEKLYHGRLEFGDSCECCDKVIGGMTTTLDNQHHASADDFCTIPGCEVCRD